MQLYQNYSNPMNNGYLQQPQNPYMTDRMNFLQGYQQSLQNPVSPVQIPVANNQMNILGKIVDSIEAVKAAEIPMDGVMYYFPKADGTEVYGKRWIVNEGRTIILAFKPIPEYNPNEIPQEDKKMKFEPSEEFKTVFMERFDSLEKQISELMTKPITKSMASKTKKEIAENE